MRRSRALAIAVRVFFATVPVWSLGLLGWVPALRIAIVRRRAVDRAFAAAAVVLTVAYVAVIGSTPEETTDWSVAQNASFGLLLLALVPGAVVHACLADLPLPPRRDDHLRAVAHGYGYPVPGHHPQPGPGYGSPGPGYGPPAGAWAPPPYGQAAPGGWGAPGATHAPAEQHQPHAPGGPHHPRPDAQHTPASGAPRTPAPGAPPTPRPGDVYPTPAPPAADAPAADAPPSSSRLRQAASELDELGELLRDQDDRR